MILPTFLESRLGDMSQGFRQLLSRRFSSIEDLPAFQTLIATLIATVVYVLGIFGQALGGRVADRHSLKWSYFLFFCAALPFVVAAALLQNALLIPAAGLFVLFTVGMQPIENSLLAFLTPARWRSMSYGIKFTITFGAGSFAVKIVGAVQQHFEEKILGRKSTRAEFNAYVRSIGLGSMLDPGPEEAIQQPKEGEGNVEDSHSWN